MKNLQKAIQDVMSSESDRERMDSLCKAFELFSYDTVRLEHAYESLNEQFQSLNLELQETNHKLQHKVAELDVITDYLKNILDNITQGILFIELDGTITTCNRAAEMILGVKSAQVILRRFWDIFADHAFGFSMQAALLAKQEEVSYSVSYVSPTQQHLELEMISTFVMKHRKNTDQDSQGMILMVRDVTEMKHLQMLAARADRMKSLGEMAAHVAHEIRNPLGGIKGYAALLKRDLSEHPELQKMASHIVEGTDNLNSLVSQILQYTRPIQPHFEVADLLNVLADIKEHVLADANIYRPDILITIDAPFDEVLLSIDVGYLKSAILNLIVNAIQAMPNGGTILLHVRKQSHHIILSVSDTGIGISEENLHKLYSPFFTTKPEGNGLGLIEVQKVIQAHGGSIDVSSMLNQGTVFTIKLPLTKVSSQKRNHL
jgi:PAS domain S-box-containing protein